MLIQIHAEANYVNSLSSDSSRRQQVQEYFPVWRTINRILGLCQQWRYLSLILYLREGTSLGFASAHVHSVQSVRYEYVRFLNLEPKSDFHFLYLVTI